MKPSRYCFCSSLNPESCTRHLGNTVAERCRCHSNWRANCKRCRSGPFLPAAERAIVLTRTHHSAEELMPITLYDLAGAEAERRFSPFCWRTKMALAHKGLEVETVPWRFTEKDKLPQPNAGRVPVIIDGDRVVHDSTVIADYLEERYPDRPPLFGRSAR